MGFHNPQYKAMPDGVSISQSDSPRSPGGRSLSVTVRHGSEAEDRDSAVNTAHDIAKKRGHDPKTARVETYGSGDSHSTTVRYGSGY